MHPQWCTSHGLRGCKTDWAAGDFREHANWVDLPYFESITLIGDAAGTSDPIQGLSLTLRDVRVLSDHLLSLDDWDAAGQAYARDHQNYFDTIHNVESWSTDLF